MTSFTSTNLIYLFTFIKQSQVCSYPAIMTLCKMIFLCVTLSNSSHVSPCIPEQLQKHQLTKYLSLMFFKIFINVPNLPSSIGCEGSGKGCRACIYTYRLDFIEGIWRLWNEYVFFGNILQAENSVNSYSCVGRISSYFHALLRGQLQGYLHLKVWVCCQRLRDLD